MTPPTLPVLPVLPDQPPRDSSRGISRELQRRAVVDTGVIGDASLSRLAYRVYLTIVGLGGWARPVVISSRECGDWLGVASDAIRQTLRLLEQRGWIGRTVRQGARRQIVWARFHDADDADDAGD